MTNPTEALPQATILVVDDDVFMGQLIARLLKRLGVDDLQVAVSGREALGLVDSGKSFGLALLDLFMPDMDGIELIEQFAERRVAFPLVMLSGHDKRFLEQARALAEKRGLRVAGVLQKPVTAPGLEALLRQALA